MSSLNSVNLFGRLVKDPELQSTPTGKVVCKFTLAVDKYGKDAGANFLDCVAWEKTAEYISKYGVKGVQTLVSGRLDQQTWEKDGKLNSRIVVIGDNVQVLSSVKEKSGASSPKKDEDINLDDIPF